MKSSMQDRVEQEVASYLFRDKVGTSLHSNLSSSCACAEEATVWRSFIVEDPEVQGRMNRR